MKNLLFVAVSVFVVGTAFASENPTEVSASSAVSKLRDVLEPQGQSVTFRGQAQGSGHEGETCTVQVSFSNLDSVSVSLSVDGSLGPSISTSGFSQTLQAEDLVMFTEGQQPLPSSIVLGKHEGAKVLYVDSGYGVISCTEAQN